MTERAIELNRDDSWAWRQHGQALLNCNRLQDALHAYDQVRREHPDDVVARNGLANLFAVLGRYEEALTLIADLRCVGEEN